MARIHKNGTLSGLMGNAVLKSCNGVTFLYSRPVEVRNPQSRGQMLQRTKKQNIVNLYGIMKPALKDNFFGKVGRQSDYSMFVSCNLSQRPVYLTESEACFRSTQVVAPYVVAFGKLTPIEYHLEGEWLVSNIQVGNMELTDKTMLMDLGDSIITRNEDWKEGDVLEFIRCRQLSGRNGVATRPFAECDYACIEVSRDDRSKLQKYLDDIQLKVNEDGFLCMYAGGEGGFAMVHKRMSVKGINVGSQSMVVNNSLLDYYCSDEQCEKAIKSYVRKKKK